MKRSEIRYAIFRCKAGTADDSQLKVLKSYQSQLDEYDYTIDDFTHEWDIDKKDFSQIVIGKIAKKYNQDRSLFAGDGALKE